MPKKAKELGPLEVSKLSTPGLHPVGSVAGLAMQITETGARSWILRVMIAGKRRDMGLGGFPDVTLAGAKQAARTAREKIKAGIDPIAETRAARSALRAALAAALHFEDAADQYITAQEAGWRNAKHVAQWRSTLKTYAYPVIGRVLVRDIDLPQVLAVLNPIWTSKTETAKRIRGRIESVLDWATVRKYREGLNPARWRGHLDKVLAKPSKIAEENHHAALRFVEIGAFMVKLRAMAGIAPRALEFAILTAARSGEVRGATWAEIDLEAATWTIPAARMKAEREHIVPLSRAVLKLLKEQPREDKQPLVFPALRGGMLSDMALTAVTRRMEVNAVPHGFRSTFRDWCAETTNYPRDAAEMALAHAIGDKVEAAYRRGDLFGKRRHMMEDWAKFCARTESESSVVIQIADSNRRAA